MSFEIFDGPVVAPRALAHNQITIGKQRISLGLYKLPFEYVEIHYDRDQPAVMLKEGTSETGFKLQKSKRYYFLTAQSFIKSGYVPLGAYECIDKENHVFKLVSEKRAQLRTPRTSALPKDKVLFSEPRLLIAILSLLTKIHESKLKKNQRIEFELADLDLYYQEIAAILGKQPDAVRMLLKRNNIDAT
jgi:hypothetical protein